MQSGFLLTPPFEQAITRSLSSARLDSYAANDEMAGFPERIARYAANVALSEALFGPLQVTELTLRSAMVPQLEEAFGTRWFDPATIGFEQSSDSYRTLDKLRQKHAPGRRGGGQPSYPNDASLAQAIVPDLTLGFWMSLFDKQFEPLWRSHLRHAFAHVGRGLRRKEIRRRIDEIRRLRNRVAHHEQIIRYDLVYHYNSMIELISFINPIMAVWASHHNRFQETYNTYKALLPAPDSGPNT